MYQIITFLTTILLTGATLLIFRKKSDGAFNVFLKIITLIFCAVGYFRFFLSDAFIYVMNGAWFENVYYETSDYLQTILRWGYFINYAVLPMAVFFDTRLFKNIASYVCLPFTILSVVFFNDFMEYFLSPKGHGFDLVEWFRYVYFIFELVLALSIPLLIQIRKKHYFNVKDKKEWLYFLVAVPFIIMLMMPVYTIQSLFGFKAGIPNSYKGYHISWIAILLAVVLIFYYSFRFRNYKDRYMLCVLLTIALFFQYNSVYLMGLNVRRLPFQLCNIAAYFYIIAIPFKLKKMFHFCFIANIVGALVAILMPDFSNGDFGFWNMYYLYEHTLVLLVPALCMGLRIFPRLKLKSLLYMWVGFTIYFTFVFIAGTIINGYSEYFGRVNYFYLFDLEMAYEYFPFLLFTKYIKIEFLNFEIYPIVILIVYVAYLLFCLIYYVAIQYLYKLEDDHLNLRLSEIDLYEKLTGKKSRRPKHYID